MAGQILFYLILSGLRMVDNLWTSMLQYYKQDDDRVLIKSYKQLTYLLDNKISTIIGSLH